MLGTVVGVLLVIRVDLAPLVMMLLFQLRMPSSLPTTVVNMIKALHYFAIVTYMYIYAQ